MQKMTGLPSESQHEKEECCGPNTHQAETSHDPSGLSREFAAHSGVGDISGALRTPLPTEFFVKSTLFRVHQGINPQVAIRPLGKLIAYPLVEPRTYPRDDSRD